jgi:tellurium resistance protein TerZ
MSSFQNEPTYIDVELTLIRGDDLAGKDRNVFGKKTSDPYVEIFTSDGATNKNVAKSKTIKKNVSPTWNETFRFSVSTTLEDAIPVQLKIYDEDLLTDPDLMGIVTVLISPMASQDSTSWFDVPPESAKNAKGKLEIAIKTKVHKPRVLVRGNAFELNLDRIQVGLAWDMVGAQQVDLDVSCVAVSSTGEILLKDTVYYGNLTNSNKSVVHSGDEKTGDKQGEDETILFHMDRIPPHILAMYIILTVSTPEMRLSDIQSALRVIDVVTQRTMCCFTPSEHPDATAMYYVRLCRGVDQSWILSPIQDTHPTARDFGSLMPYIKSYTLDLVPNIQIDPTERLAILRKGGNIRLADYCKSIPDEICFGLSWDVTKEKSIDLDASVVCLDEYLNLVDKVYFKHLVSEDGAITHCGDEREGDARGDDEKINLKLAQVDPRIRYIGFVITSFSGAELDDVARAFCHLYDPKGGGGDMASYALTNSSSLNGHTALHVACLYRETSESEWCLSIVSQPAQAKTAKRSVGSLQDYLRAHPPQVPPLEEQEIDLSQMPEPVPLEDGEIDLSQPTI